jgi:hypothetical protein
MIEPIVTERPQVSGLTGPLGSIDDRSHQLTIFVVQDRRGRGRLPRTLLTTKSP